MYTTASARIPLDADCRHSRVLFATSVLALYQRRTMTSCRRTTTTIVRNIFRVFCTEIYYSFFTSPSGREGIGFATKIISFLRGPNDPTRTRQDSTTIICGDIFKFQTRFFISRKRLLFASLSLGRNFFISLRLNLASVFSHKKNVFGV